LQPLPADIFVMKILTRIGAFLFLAALALGQGAARKNVAITAVAGESWLHHIHRPFDETSMGKTLLLGPPEVSIDRAVVFVRLSDSPRAGSRTQSRTLHGSDLYRINCQGCHGEAGLGAPPEIGSLIDPVRATSATLVDERMKKLGMALGHRETAELVNQSRTALLKRLHEGGQDMPAFHHLSEAEIRPLLAYLRQLAGVPGAELEQVAIQESRARIGELIVKSTCHICHDATGLNPTPAELSEGAIPPLSALPERVSQAQLARKVTGGAPVIMGTTSSTYRGRMPVFSYLSENEAADVYEYLTHYPPTELASASQISQMSRPNAASPPTDPSRASSAAPQPVPSQIRVTREQSESVALPIGAGLFVAALIVLMCWITWREFRRLSAESEARAALRRRGIASTPWVTFRPAVEVRTDSASRQAESAEHKPLDWVNERKIS